MHIFVGDHIMTSPGVLCGNHCYGAGTHNTLFGPPSPTLSRAEKARINARKQTDYSIKPSKKPFPGIAVCISYCPILVSTVNPLTGDILGQPGMKSPTPPRRQSKIVSNTIRKGLKRPLVSTVWAFQNY